MSTVRIDEEERELKDADAQWVTQQIQARRAAGVNPCIVVRIESAGIQVVLATPNCAGGTAGGRPPRPEEQAIIDLWRERKLNDPDYAPGSLVAFLAQVRR